MQVASAVIVFNNSMHNQACIATSIAIVSLLAKFCTKHHRVDYWTFLQIELLLSATALIHKYGGHEPCDSLAIHSYIVS